MLCFGYMYLRILVLVLFVSAPAGSLLGTKEEYKRPCVTMFYLVVSEGGNLIHGRPTFTQVYVNKIFGVRESKFIEHLRLISFPFFLVFFWAVAGSLRVN